MTGVEQDSESELERQLQKKGGREELEKEKEREGWRERVNILNFRCVHVHGYACVVTLQYTCNNIQYVHVLVLRALNLTFWWLTIFMSLSSL